MACCPVWSPVDMPIGNLPISGRRSADDQVSREFGHAACSVHSPTAERPGAVSTAFVQGFQGAHYQCDFGAGVPAGALIEVYPHVALLALAQAERRLPYKATKTATYWKRSADPGAAQAVDFAMAGHHATAEQPYRRH